MTVNFYTLSMLDPPGTNPSHRCACPMYNSVIINPSMSGDTQTSGVSPLCRECDLSFLHGPSSNSLQLISLHQAAMVMGEWRRHQTGQMATPSPLVSLVASYSPSYCFILAWKSHQGFWYGRLSIASVRLRMMNLVLGINVSYEQCCLVNWAGCEAGSLA